MTSKHKQEKPTKAEQLAIEIFYASGKDIELSVDDWLKKIQDLLKAQRIEYIKGLRKEIPRWRRTSMAHSDNHVITVECFIEYLEKNNE